MIHLKRINSLLIKKNQSMAMNRFFCLEITEKNQFPIHESQNRPNSSSEFFFPFHSFFALERRGDSTHMSLSLLFMGGRELICHCSDLGRTFGAVFASYLISRERGGANLDGVSQSRAISVAKKNSEATPAPKWGILTPYPEVEWVFSPRASSPRGP